MGVGRYLILGPFSRDYGSTIPTKEFPDFLHATLSVCENTLPQGGERFHY